MYYIIFFFSRNEPSLYMLEVRGEVWIWRDIKDYVTRAFQSPSIHWLREPWKTVRTRERTPLYFILLSSDQRLGNHTQAHWVYNMVNLPQGRSNVIITWKGHQSKYKLRSTLLDFGDVNNENWSMHCGTCFTSVSIHMFKVKCLEML